MWNTDKVRLLVNDLANFKVRLIPFGYVKVQATEQTANALNEAFRFHRLLSLMFVT